MKNRILSIILAVIMIVGMLPLSAIPAFAQDVSQPLAIPTADDFTFIPPQNCIYDGLPKKAIVISDKSGMGTITLKYRKHNGEGWDIATTDVPTDVGKYKVVISVNEGMNFAASAADISSDSWVFEITEDIQLCSVTYIDQNGEEQTAENCIVMSSTEPVTDYSFESGEWYVVKGTFTVTNRIENNASSNNPAHLILGYDAVLNANMGISNPDGKGLVIYTHSESAPGTLVADTPRSVSQFNDNAGIGGNHNESGGYLMICGGIITATGGYTGGAGIGGGYNGDGGNVTITGGTVTAIGGEANGGAGIGGGLGGDCGNVTITGGNVTAKGLTVSSGIGGGYKGNGGIVTITGGEVLAKGYNSPAIGAGVDGTSNGKFTLGDGLDMFVGFSEKYAKYQIYELYAYTLDYYVKITPSPSYTVKHYKQNTDKTGYELADTETLSGHTGNKTTASFKWYEGFAPLVFDQQTINADGSTVVEIYYNKVASAHEHTYSENWSCDPYYHWHDATCEHSGLTSAFGEHTFDDGVADGNTTTYTCTECDYMKIVYNIEDDAEGEVITEISFTGISLTLDSDIFINFYMNLTEEAKQKGTMTFDIGGRIVTIKGTNAKYNAKEDIWYFRAPLTVLEMAETITATFSCDGIDYIQQYSVEEYIEKILNGKDKDGNDYADEMKMLARKIANYGYYAQIYLASIHTNVKIVDPLVNPNSGYDRMIHFTDTDTETYDINVSAAQTALANYNITVNGSSENLSLYGSTVHFDSATALNYYIKVEGNVELTANALDTKSRKYKDVVIKHYKDNIYIVSVKGITATELADTITVTANDGLTITGSVFAYCNAVMNKVEQTDAAKNAMAAFYEYYLAAAAYDATQK